MQGHLSKRKRLKCTISQKKKRKRVLWRHPREGEENILSTTMEAKIEGNYAV